MASSADCGAFKKNARIPSLMPIFCETFFDGVGVLIDMMVQLNAGPQAKIKPSHKSASLE